MYVGIGFQNEQLSEKKVEVYKTVKYQIILSCVPLQLFFDLIIMHANFRCFNS